MERASVLRVASQNIRKLHRYIPKNSIRMTHTMFRNAKYNMRITNFFCTKSKDSPKMLTRKSLLVLKSFSSCPSVMIFVIYEIFVFVFSRII